jgi:RHS repeat-associated protein
MIERADGTTISQTWTASGKLLTRANDALDRTTTYGYNGRNELVSVTDPMRQVTGYGRDLTGNLTSTATPGSSCSGKVSRGCVTRSYDAAGELSGVTYHDGTTPNVTNVNYDADGRLVAETDGSGTSSWVYDSLGRLTDTTDGSKAHTAYGYDLDGNTTSIKYPGGRTVTRHFDAVDELDSVNDGSGNATAFGYDVDGNLTQTTYPAGTGEVDRDVYLRTDALETITDKGRTGTLANFDYTRDGTNRVNASTTTGAEPGTQVYRYDSLHELTSSGAAGSAVGYGYDAAGDITAYGQDAGTSQTQTYNADGQLCWTTTEAVSDATCGQAPVESVSYDYDAAGDRAAKTTSTAGAVRIDTRVSRDSTFGSMATTKAFDTSGPDTLLALVSSNGKSKQTTTVGGARLNWRLIARANGRGGTAEIWTATATQALTGVRVWAKQQQTPFDQSITVVALSHAAGVGATVHASGKTGAPSVALTATAKGSMTFAAGHDPDSADRRKITSGHARMHEFQDKAAKTDEWAQRTKDVTSKAGKTIAVADAAPKSDRWDVAAAEVVPTPVLHTTGYRYDAAGDLTSIAPPSGTGDRFRYDAAGLRTSEAGRATATFTWDTRGASAALLSDGSHTFIYGPDGIPLEQIGQHGSVVWLHHGQVGNTRLLTDKTGAVVGTYSYGPYAQRVTHTGTASTPLQFGGGYTDASSGLIYLQQRYYDPATAQFISAATGTTTRPDEPYAYAVADPVNTVQPSGAGVRHPYARSTRAWLDVTETSPRCAPTAPSCGPSGAG